jgi:hypothetical protein
MGEEVLKSPRRQETRFISLTGWDNLAQGNSLVKRQKVILHAESAHQRGQRNIYRTEFYGLKEWQKRHAAS